MSLKFVPAFAFLFSCLRLSPLLGAEEINIYFKSSPRLELLRPFSDPANLSLLVTAADGRPLPQGWVEIRLDAPRRARFFSTDFPLVEGSRLTEMRLPLRQGKIDWKYLFPIRGDYRMIVDVSTGDGKKGSQIFEFTIRENEKKWSFLALFSLGLFVLGIIAGRIFSPPGLGRKEKLVFFWFLCSGMVLCFLKTVCAQEAATQKYAGQLEIEAATVGKPSLLRWRLDAQGVGERPLAALTLTIAHIEKGKTVFAVERLPVRGEFSMHFHFPDGADYRVTASAAVAGEQTSPAEQQVSVTAVEPPLSARLSALAFFLVVIAGGLGVGRWSRRAAPP